jgi:hypothetical protein
MADDLGVEAPSRTFATKSAHRIARQSKSDHGAALPLTLPSPRKDGEREPVQLTLSLKPNELLAPWSPANS